MSIFENQEWETFEFQESPGLGEWEAQEWESGEAGEYENQEQFLGGALGAEMESSHQEMELATELLEISSEEELEQFLGKLIRSAAKAVGGIVRSPIGNLLGGALKKLAKTALPMAAGALGNLVLPGVGGVIGSKLGSMATNLFEVELEGLNEQEAELEIARRYVRFATAAARNAARAPSDAPPRAVARAALISAARRHAPGLVQGGRSDWQQPGRPMRFRPRRGYGYGYGGGRFAGDYGTSDDGGRPDWDDDDGGYGSDGPEPSGERSDEGRWIRRGRKILILGL